MKTIWLLASFLGITVFTKAQTKEDSIKATINTLFTAMKTSDSNALRTCFADSAILQTIEVNKKGNVKIRNEKLQEFIQQISQLPKGAAEERITITMIKTDADLASVWCDYRFYFNGNFSHCGVNSFQLVRINGLWKIQFIIDTRRKAPCES